MAFPLPDVPSIAVMPFVNMSEDPKQEFLCDGMTDEIITALSKVPRLFVISRQSTFFYKGKPVKIKQVSEELGVQYVLEGGVQRSGDRVRITVQLIDALTGRHLWAERYERDLKDLFALEDEIIMKILTGIRVKLTEGEISSAYLEILQREARFRLLFEATGSAQNTLTVALSKTTTWLGGSSRKLFQCVRKIQLGYAHTQRGLPDRLHASGTRSLPGTLLRKVMSWRKKPLPWMIPYPLPTVCCVISIFTKGSMTRRLPKGNAL